MNARPIIFSAPMIRALFEGRKTQTRRIVKPQPTTSFWEPYSCPDGRWNWVMKNTGMGSGDPFRCRFGQPGDGLWVRETFCTDVIRALDLPQIIYAADYYGQERPHIRWRPSIHMPRWASRLTLRITDVQVQRLQEISEEDARAEGITDEDVDQELMMAEAMNQREPTPAAARYRLLWESIHGPGSWSSNPWVWALTFDVIHKNVDEVSE